LRQQERSGRDASDLRHHFVKRGNQVVGHDLGRRKANWFRNDIDNFIEQTFIPFTGAPPCPGPPFCYEPDENTLWSFTVDNLLDEQYARYLDVIPVSGVGSIPFPSPGRTFKVAYRKRFAN
jgi:hypothetical protein